MLYNGQNIIITIRDIAFGGNGVGTAEDGLTIFVPYSAPGDKLRVELTKVKKRFAEAKIVEIITPSPFRVEPKSKDYAAAPITQYEHISYDKQLEIKQTQLCKMLVMLL